MTAHKGMSQPPTLRHNGIVDYTLKVMGPVVSRRLESLSASSSTSSNFLFPLSLITGLLSLAESAGEADWSASERAGAIAGLLESVRLIPDAIMDGRGTETFDPFCLF